MTEHLKEARDIILKSIHEQTITQDEINRLFRSLNEHYNEKHGAKMSSSYYSNCKCCDGNFKEGEVTNGLCYECNIEINRVIRNKKVKKYLKGDI